MANAMLGDRAAGMTASWRRQLGRGLFAAVAAVVLAAVGYSLAQIFDSYDRAPFWDMIPLDGYLNDNVFVGNRIDWVQAARLRINEHRPVFPMIVWIIDRAWLHSSAILPIIVILACTAGTAAILGWLALRSPGPRPPRLLLLVAGAAMKSTYLGREIPKNVIKEATPPPTRPRLPAGFDPELYLQANPDVRGAGADPIQHYLTYGIHENRPLAPKR